LTESNRLKSDTVYAFDQVCQDHRIEHHITRVKNSWTNGMVKAMNNMNKKITVKQFPYEMVDALKRHPHAYHNFKLE